MSRTVVLGDPGAGKSTLTEKIAHDLATDPARVPIRVVLRDISEAVRTRPGLLAEHVLAAVHEVYNVDLAPEELEYLLLNGHAVVLLDGLDELTDVALRGRVARSVESFAHLYPTVPIVVTSRRIGYREAPLTPQLFEEVTIAPLDVAGVERYAANWFRLDEALRPQDRARLTAAFLKESAAVPDLRGNPLLLSLLCTMYSAEQYIPRNRSEVYRKCAELIFERWDALRGIGGPRSLHGRVRGAVRELAWRLFTGGKSSELPRGRVMVILIEHLVGKGFDHDDAEATAAEFLRHCAGRAWVLEEVGSTREEPVYGFAHRTFLEYFAAEHLTRHHVTPAEVWAVLEPHITEGSWTVVTQLALQLLDRNQENGADIVLGHILDSLLLRSSDERRDLHVFLSLTCGELELSPRILKRITGAVVGQARTLPFAERRPFFTAQTPEGTGLDEPLELLLLHLLDTNRAPVYRHLARLAASGAEDRDPLIPLLLDTLHRKGLADGAELLAEFDGLLTPESRAWLNEWRRLLPSPDDDGRTAVEPVSPDVLYRWWIRCGVAVPPVVMGHIGGPGTPGGASPRVTRDLARALLELPTPWLSVQEWTRDLAKYGETHQQYGSGHPRADKINAGERCLLLLPYMEIVADAHAEHQVGIVLPGAWAFIGRRRETRAGRTPFADVPLPAECEPNEFWDFLQRWARNEFSVLG
ncbi:NACHT domain-containing protein [Phytomonospora sp. NPDC050363]|uniref:NACHT domain-containing protein n=1 Tax=Phytomonospora sp. NPDC050363 TaxID=3155642 RepID=UPI0033DED4FE